MNKTLLALLALALASAAHAKLPPPAPEKQAAAALAKEKAAWGDKVASYQLCLVQNRVAEQYFKSHPAAKKPSADVPACANPGPFVAQADAAKTAPPKK